MGVEMGRDRVVYVHLTLVPYIATSAEIKTKPTQHSVKELRSIGIQPDILVCRSEQVLPAEHRRKIALFTNVPEKQSFRPTTLMISTKFRKSCISRALVTLSSTS